MSLSSNTLNSPVSSPSTPNSTPQPCSLHATSFSSPTTSPEATSPSLPSGEQLLGESADDGDDDEEEQRQQEKEMLSQKSATKSVLWRRDEAAKQQAGPTVVTFDSTTTTSETLTSVADCSSISKTTPQITSDNTSKCPKASSVGQRIFSSSSSSSSFSSSSNNLKSQQKSNKSSCSPPESQDSVGPDYPPNLQTERTISGTNISQQLMNQNQPANRLMLAANNKFKLETTCNILSRQSPNLITAGSSKSRSQDLSTSSANPSNAPPPVSFKTRPLLMNHHNHHSQSLSLSASSNLTNRQNFHATTKATTKATTTSNTIATTSKPNFLATLTPQLILSQMITASPAQRGSLMAHQAALSSTGLDGLQFCLNTTSHVAGQHQPLQGPVASTSDLPTAGSQLIKVQALTPTHRPSNPPRPSSSLDCKPRVKLHNQNNNSNSNSNKQQQVEARFHVPFGDAAEQMVEGAALNQSGNVAAARLLDLGKKLIEATRSGQLEHVRQLVEDSGAPFTSDWLGTTALHVAAQQGFADIAEVLVRGGVNREARTKLERTALHMAAQSGSLEIVDLLLVNGSDANARDMLKMTPLHWAVERGHVYVAERLIMAGADVELANKFRLTPVDIARESRSFEMIELFKNRTGGNKDEQSLDAYSSLPGSSISKGRDFLDIDYHLAFVNSATTNSRSDSMLDIKEESCIDLVELEWNKIDFDPDLFLPSENEDEPKVEYLMKVVEELQKENQQLRQKVEQLTTVDP